MSRRVVFTFRIPSFAGRLLRRTLEEMRAYREFSSITPFTTKATIGTALFGSLVLGTKAAHKAKPRGKCYCDPDDYHICASCRYSGPGEDIAFSMFGGAVSGAIAGFLWPVTLSVFVPTYTIHKGLVVYAKARMCEQQRK